jgi:hypothetical protein
MAYDAEVESTLFGTRPTNQPTPRCRSPLELETNTHSQLTPFRRRFSAQHARRYALQHTSYSPPRSLLYVFPEKVDLGVVALVVGEALRIE